MGTFIHAFILQKACYSYRLYRFFALKSSLLRKFIFVFLGKSAIFFINIFFSINCDIYYVFTINYTLFIPYNDFAAAVHYCVSPYYFAYTVRYYSPAARIFYRYNISYNICIYVGIFKRKIRALHAAVYES